MTDELLSRRVDRLEEALAELSQEVVVLRHRLPKDPLAEGFARFMAGEKREDEDARS